MFLQNYLYLWIIEGNVVFVKLCQIILGFHNFSVLLKNEQNRNKQNETEKILRQILKNL